MCFIRIFQKKNSYMSSKCFLFLIRNKLELNVVYTRYEIFSNSNVSFTVHFGLTRCVRNTSSPAMVNTYVLLTVSSQLQSLYALGGLIHFSGVYCCHFQSCITHMRESAVGPEVGKPNIIMGAIRILRKKYMNEQQQKKKKP